MSTLTPFPVGNLKELILPTLSDQSLEMSSAVIRSCRECIGGGVSGFSERVESGSAERGCP